MITLQCSVVLSFLVFPCVSSGTFEGRRGGVGKSVERRAI